MAGVTFTLFILLFASNFFLRGLILDDSFLYSVVLQENVTESKPTFNIKGNVRLVSYNLWCDHLKPHTYWNINERIVALAEGIKNYDIALIQEAYILNTGVAILSKCASMLVTEMTKHGFRYRTSIEDFAAPFIGKSGGIVIFSRIPLARTASSLFHNYSVFQLADYRGLVVGEYFVNSRRLYVVNTHLDPHQAKVRTLQSKELVTVVKSFTKPSHVVVGGDFNIDNHYPTISHSSEEYIKLLQTMNEAGLRSVFPIRVETNIDGGNYDAMFTSSNVAVVSKQIINLETASKEIVSDHFGLAIEVKLL